MLRSSRSVLLSRSFVLALALALVACANDDEEARDDDAGDQEPDVNVTVSVDPNDPGTERTLPQCTTAKPYMRCNVFGHCRCSAYP